MRRARALVLVVAAACARAPRVERAAITYGTVDEGDGAVAALLLRVSSCGDPPVVFCTGTLIAPRAILTAAHCLDAAPAGAVLVFFGGDARAAGEAHAVAARLRHPDPDIDLGLLALDDTAAAPPLTVGGGPAPAPGTTVRLIGFGADEAHVAGVKRQGSARVDATSERELRVAPAPALACAGDSGGPLLVSDGSVERVAGVAAYGDSSCAVSAVYSAVAASAAFIADGLAQIAALPAAPARPAPVPTEGCERACADDRACPLGFVCTGAHGCALAGDAAASIGAACSSDDGCDGARCVALEGGCRCVIPCQPFRASGGCSFAAPGAR